MQQTSQGTRNYNFFALATLPFRQISLHPGLWQPITTVYLPFDVTGNQYSQHQALQTQVISAGIVD